MIINVLMFVQNEKMIFMMFMTNTNWIELNWIEFNLILNMVHDWF